MIKYYTRACNFFYGSQAKKIIKNRTGLPLCGNNKIAFTSLEIFSRKKKFIKSKYINVKDIKSLKKKEKEKIKLDIKKITSKRKNFLKYINFSKPTVMGILNLTPDSFSDGGKFNSKVKSFKHISQMIKSGAMIIDIGGESTRPGSKDISLSNELKRIKKVLKSFKKKYKKICLSLDTRKSQIMKYGLNFGVDLINDVSGFSYDQNSFEFIKKNNVPKVLHHMKGTPNTMQINPNYENVLLDIYDFFEKNIENKFSDRKIILDPGIGFGKTLKHNLTLISKVSLFHSLGLPIMIGTSRKRFINQIVEDYDSKERIGGTMASVLHLLSQGVQIFRVHNVLEIKQGILVFNKILFEK
tara:strand:- start:122 stop:1186 length:1065 start_codon:yes stop_codon:yes gene_type:complete